MRLIDADALKEKSYLDDFAESVVTVEDINNAPTVNLEKTSFMKGYNYGCDDGKRFYERPQGEWNYIQADMCVCPFCGAMPHKLYKNFCAKCGAEMRGINNG